MNMKIVRVDGTPAEVGSYASSAADGTFTVDLIAGGSAHYAFVVYCNGADAKCTTSNANTEISGTTVANSAVAYAIDFDMEDIA